MCKRGNIITLKDSFTHVGAIKPLPVCLNRGYNSVTLVSFARRRLPFVLNNEREMMPFGEICHCLLFSPSLHTAGRSIQLICMHIITRGVHR